MRHRDKVGQLRNIICCPYDNSLQCIHNRQDKEHSVGRGIWCILCDRSTIYSLVHYQSSRVPYRVKVDRLQQCWTGMILLVNIVNALQEKFHLPYHECGWYKVTSTVECIHVSHIYWKEKPIQQHIGSPLLTLLYEIQTCISNCAHSVAWDATTHSRQ